jgi:hypothetical protein
MNWMIILKGVSSVMAMKKVKEFKADLLYDKAPYLPVIYFCLFAPGMLFLIGTALYAYAGVSMFYLNIEIPMDFILTLGGVSWLLSAVSYAIFNFFLKKALPAKEVINPRQSASIKENIVYAVEPFVTQFRAEHEKMF